MTDLIDLDAAIAALSERQSNYREETSTWAQIALDILILRARPAIDPADRIRELESKLALMMFERDEAWKRAAHSEKMWGEAEVKLAKAVEALREISCKCVSNCDWERGDICPSWTIRTVLGELEGENE